MQSIWAFHVFPSRSSSSSQTPQISLDRQSQAPKCALRLYPMLRIFAECDAVRIYGIGKRPPEFQAFGEIKSRRKVLLSLWLMGGAIAATYSPLYRLPREASSPTESCF